MDYLKRIVVFIKSFFQKKTTTDDDVEIGKESFVLQLIKQFMSYTPRLIYYWKITQKS